MASVTTTEKGSSPESRVLMESSSMNSRRPRSADNVSHSLHIPCCLMYKWWKESSHYSQYVQLLNNCVDTVQLDVNCKSLAKRLQVKVSKVCHKVKKLKGRPKMVYLNEESILFDVHHSEIISASELSHQVELLKTEVEELHQIVIEKDNCVKQLEEEVMKQKCILQTSNVDINLGKNYDEVQARQKARKVPLSIFNDF